MTTLTDTSTLIANQNDTFRHQIPLLPSWPNQGAGPGTTVYTPRVGALSPEHRLDLFFAVRDFSAFGEHNDPHGEHDFGAIDLHGSRWFWKIDYYADAQCDAGSEDPSDITKCYRVLTIMHASKY